MLYAIEVVRIIAKSYRDRALIATARSAQQRTQNTAENLPSRGAADRPRCALCHRLAKPFMVSSARASAAAEDCAKRTHPSPARGWRLLRRRTIRLAGWWLGRFRGNSRTRLLLQTLVRGFPIHRLLVMSEQH